MKERFKIKFNHPRKEGDITINTINMTATINIFTITLKDDISALALYVIMESLRNMEYNNILEIGDITTNGKTLRGILASEIIIPITDYMMIMKTFDFIESITSEPYDKDEKESYKMMITRTESLERNFLIEKES